MPSIPRRAQQPTAPQPYSPADHSKRRGLSHLEEHFALQLRALGLADTEREYYFAKPRRWRFDFAFPALKLAVEIEGGTWVNGRHNRGVGFEADMEKYNHAGLLGWTVLRFSSASVLSGDAVRTTLLALNMKAAA